MNIFEEDNHCPVMGNIGDKLSRIMKSKVADLFGIIKNPFEMPTCRVIESYQMTNEMSTPKILACPADTGRRAADNWSSYSAANCSYEYLAPSAPDGREPQRLLFRCPMHGHIGLMYGSVQSEVAKNHPEWIVRRDEKLYLETK